MHNIFYVDMNENGNKGDLEERLYDHARRDGDGICVSFRWDNSTLKNNRKEAEDYLEKIAEKHFYYCGAVKYYAYPSLKSSKKDTLMKKKDIYTKKLNDLNQKNHFADLKSKLFTCSNCESKVNKNYIRYNQCPCCGQDLRSKTVLDTIQKYKVIIDETARNIEEEEKSLQEKARKKGQVEIKWLVRCEYHS